MNSTPQLRLGTRSSLLAVAQSELIRAQLERLSPGLSIELVRTDTRGDADQNTPLTRVNDPDFFSAELDAALLAGQVDFCVHSYKDLTRQRPAGISRIAIPEREQPHDVVLFRSDIIEHLESTSLLRLGTCSLRREANVSDFLQDALPVAGEVKIQTKALRGPVDERIQKIAAHDGEPELDAVVIALAGLNRLWTYAPGRAAIEATLRAARLMVLPLSQCPAAPGQGALAIECRTADTTTQRLLAGLHNPATAELLELEHRLLNDMQANPTCGATVVADPELGYVARVRGRTAPRSKQAVGFTRTRLTPAGAGVGKAWNDMTWRRTQTIEPLPAELPAAGAMFVAHWRALQGRAVSPAARIWTSGVTSWRKLAQQGVWVAGCADNLGFEQVKSLLHSPALHLPTLTDWTAVTHADAVGSWSDSGVGQVLATYRNAASTTAEIEIPADCTHFYWSSARQFELLRDKLPGHARHACGSGKTLRQLRAAGLDNINVFVSRQDWLQWLT